MHPRLWVTRLGCARGLMAKENAMTKNKSVSGPRLYEQQQANPERATLLGEYVIRWLRWAQAGLGVVKTRVFVQFGVNNGWFPLELAFINPPPIGVSFFYKGRCSRYVTIPSRHATYHSQGFRHKTCEGAGRGLSDG